jgi:hypothetical protein
MPLHESLSEVKHHESMRQCALIRCLPDPQPPAELCCVFLWTQVIPMDPWASHGHGSASTGSTMPGSAKSFGQGRRGPLTPSGAGAGTWPLERPLLISHLPSTAPSSQRIAIATAGRGGRGIEAEGFNRPADTAPLPLIASQLSPITRQ